MRGPPAAISTHCRLQFHIGRRYRRLHNDDARGHEGIPNDGASRPNGAPHNGAARRIAVVSCTGPTRPQSARARDLFVSPLFQELCAFADREADRWFLLDAEHGLLDPETVIAPTTKSIGRKESAARREWARRVIQQLVPVLDGVEQVLVLANARSREYLLDFLGENGRQVEVPMDGLSLGEQLQWLRKQNGGARR